MEYKQPFHDIKDGTFYIAFSAKVFLINRYVNKKPLFSSERPHGKDRICRYMRVRPDIYFPFLSFPDMELELELQARISKVHGITTLYAVNHTWIVFSLIHDE